MVLPYVSKMVEYEYQHSIDGVHKMVLVVSQYFYCLERKTIMNNRIKRIIVSLKKGGIDYVNILFGQRKKNTIFFFLKTIDL